MKKYILYFILLFSLINLSTAQAQRVMEKLNRGLVAVRTSYSKVFLSWRMLGSDPDDVAFNLYRDGIKINASPISDVTNYSDNAVSATEYKVKTVINGVETGEEHIASVLATNYFDIPMKIPAPMTMPDGSVCYYSPNDCSVGDVDGDGEYEIVVKWEPSNAKDNSQSGYTGNVFIDVYKINGTQLCRIDLGKNIRAGAHYTQFQVADYDGDGKAEIAAKTAPGTKDGLGNFISKGPAATANHAADYRNTSGYILTGPEYFTVFSGLTGEELATANYNPPRGTVSNWGDSYGNRVDRFLAGTAWLDGVLPSIIMCRGYYTRATIAAWNFRNGNLSQVWFYDSGTTSGVGLYGQGNHNMAIADIDNDGRDEIVWSSGAVDHDGKFMYRTGLGHGDAMHLSDLDPDRKGLEVFSVHESTSAAYGEEMHDARTGDVMWGTFTGSDNGRGLAGNIIPGNRGFEMWSASVGLVKSKTGETLSTTRPSMNFRIYWDGDREDELMDGTSITKFGVGTLFSAPDCSSINGTKATPNLSVDLFGDWREEVIFRTADNEKLRVFTTTIPTDYRVYTLMHDPVYRASIAWQNTAYNQPPHLGYYMGNDMYLPPVSAVYAGEKRWKAGSVWDNNTSASWTDSINQTSVFKNGDRVVFDLTTGANAVIAVVGELSPKSMKVNSPYNVEITGTGTLNGTMSLKKIGSGILKLSNNNNFTGGTTIWDGEFHNNGVLKNSEVIIMPFVKIAGKGVFGNDVTLSNRTTVSPGSNANETAKLTFGKNLTESGVVTFNFDIVLANNVVASHDTLYIEGDWNTSNKSVINLNVSNGSLPAGNYILFKVKGSIKGDLSKIKVTGVPSYLSYTLVNINGDVSLKVSPPAYLIWKGYIDDKWDNGKTKNWILNDEVKTFNQNDSVLFNDETNVKSIIVNETISPGSIFIETASNYNFSGTGSIEGAGNLTKRGSGKVTLGTTNKFTGKLIINDGTVETNTITNGGVASPIGAASKAATNIVLNGGRLSYTGATATIDRSFTLGANGGILSIGNYAAVLTTTGQFTGPGRLIKEGSGRLSVAVANNYTGGTTIKAGSIGFTTDVANTSGLGSTDTITLMGGSLIMFDSQTTDNTSNWNLKIPTGYVGTLNVDGRSVINGTITGSGTLNYYTGFTGNVLNSDVSSYSGIINITTDADGGNFVIGSTKGYERTKINLSNYVTMIYRNTSNIVIPVGDLTGNTNSILGAGGSGNATIIWEIGARNANSTFNGKITNTQYSGTGAVTAIRKVGTGSWTLTNNNTYTGGTEINYGELIVNNTTGSGTGSGYVNVNYESTLSGSGSVDGKVTIYEGGALNPGKTIGAFTVNNDVEFKEDAFLIIDLDKATSSNDILNLSGKLTMNGKLQINPSPETVFADGDSFKIINGNITSLPAEIIPTKPADDLEWDVSDFIGSGILKVKKATGLRNLSLSSEIFPNPAKNTLRINIPTIEANTEITMLNTTGHVMLKEIINNESEIQLNISSLSNGIYFLKIRSGADFYTGKFIKN